LSHEEADLSCKPDFTFAAHESFTSKKVLMVEGIEGGYVELLGSPDMVLEVVSDSSEYKDTVLLKEAYWNARIDEYWLVDAREENLRFDIFKHTSKGYTSVRDKEGWKKSHVFGTSFRLLRLTPAKGQVDFRLETK
jgi:Uma2 family endonuclease